MTYAAAITRLKTLTFTGLANSYSVVNEPPSPNELPALVIEDVSQPFSESLIAWNVIADKTIFRCFVDHKLLIEPIQNGTIESRYTNMTTYLDRYLIAISADMKLNNNLATPLQLIVINRTAVQVRKRTYSGIIFRHLWQIKV